MTGARQSIRYELLRRLALQSRKAQYVLRRMERAVGAWTGALLHRALRDGEKEALSIDLYDVSFRPENDRDGLYAWEMQWFERRLPPPPASVLIGAAGAGREAVALRKLGYDVRAFEPSASAFRLCQLALGSGVVDRASYRDLVATVLNGQRTGLSVTAEARFDAVLLGWGSFGHVLQPNERLELLRACDQITPHGPILLSLFDPTGSPATKGVHYLPWGGFLAQPSMEELDRHAGALNRELVVSIQSPTSYATLLPAV